LRIGEEVKRLGQAVALVAYLHERAPDVGKLRGTLAFLHSHPQCDGQQ
jgi:hypothetical protein